MATITFDTLAYSQKLQKSGVPREQAEAMAQANSEIFNAMVNIQQLATKQDLLKLKHEFPKWVVGMMAAQTTLIITALGIGIVILK